MANDYPRSVRVGDQIQRELAALVRDELKDPSIPDMLTIVSVEVSRDLSIARVYYSSLQQFDAEAARKALERSAGFLRRRLADGMRMRNILELRFSHDESIETGNRMSALIDAAVRSNTTSADHADDAGSDLPVDPDDPASDQGTRQDY